MKTKEYFFPYSWYIDEKETEIYNYKNIWT